MDDEYTSMLSDYDRRRKQTERLQRFVSLWWWATACIWAGLIVIFTRWPAIDLLLFTRGIACILCVGLAVFYHQGESDD